MTQCNGIDCQLDNAPCNAACLPKELFLFFFQSPSQVLLTLTSSSTGVCDRLMWASMALKCPLTENDIPMEGKKTSCKILQ